MLFPRKHRGLRYPVDEAICNNHPDVASFLRQEVNDENIMDTGKYIRQTSYCAASGDIDGITRHISHGLNPNGSLYGSRTPLHIAARKGQLKVYNLHSDFNLISMEFDLLARRSCMAMQVAQFLLEQGAKINSEDMDGCTPLMDAITGGHSLMVQLLRFHGGQLGHELLVRPPQNPSRCPTADASFESMLGILRQHFVSPQAMDVSALRTACTTPTLREMKG